MQSGRKPKTYIIIPDCGVVICGIQYSSRRIQMFRSNMPPASSGFRIKSSLSVYTTTKWHGVTTQKTPIWTIPLWELRNLQVVIHPWQACMYFSQGPSVRMHDSTRDSLDEFWRNLIWMLCSWRSPPNSYPSAPYSLQQENVDVHNSVAMATSLPAALQISVRKMVCSNFLTKMIRDFSQFLEKRKMLR